MSGDDVDALVVWTDPLHVRLFHETRTDSEIPSMYSPRIPFQSCVLGFIDSVVLLELEVASLSALGGSSSISRGYPLRF